MEEQDKNEETEAPPEPKRRKLSDDAAERRKLRSEKLKAKKQSGKMKQGAKKKAEAIDTWNVRFEELKAFKNEHGVSQ